MPSAGDVEFYQGNIVDFTVATGQTIVKGDCVDITGDWEVSKANAVSDKGIGVALNGGTEGEKVEVLIMAPIVYVVAEGAVVAGNFLTPSTTAGAVQAFDETITGVGVVVIQVIVGLCIEGASDGETFAMMLLHGIVKDTGT